MGIEGESVLQRALKNNVSKPLGDITLDPNTALGVGEDNELVNRLRNRAAQGSSVRVSRGYVPKSVTRVLGDHGYFPNQGPEYLQEVLASEQTAGGQFLSFLNQAVVGEIVGGTIEGVGYLLDLPQYASLVDGTEQEWGNWLSDIGKGLKSWTKESTPVYVSPDAPDFNPSSWAWWMKNAPSVASTISLMIPAAGAIRGVSMLGKAMNIGQTMGKTASWMAKGIGQAVVSRHMENLMESSGVWEELYKEGLNIGMNEEDAKERASLGASNTYNKQWLMLMQDIPQYLLLNKLGGAGPSTTNTSRGVLKALGANQFKGTGQKAARIIKDMVGEGGEEIYQYLINEQSKVLARHGDDPNYKYSFLDSLKDNYSDGELWTSAVMGALGAGTMQAGFAGLNAKMIQQKNSEAVKEVKKFGPSFNQAYQIYTAALESGDPIKIENAMANALGSLALSSKERGVEQHLIDFIEAMKNPNDDILVTHGINEEGKGFISENPESADELIQQVKTISKNYDRFQNEGFKNPKIEDKDLSTFTRNMTLNQYLLDTNRKALTGAKERLEKVDLAELFEDEDKGGLTLSGKVAFKAKHAVEAIQKNVTRFKNKVEITKDDPNTGAWEKAMDKYVLAAEEYKLEQAKTDYEAAKKDYSKVDRENDKGKIVLGKDEHGDPVDDRVSEYLTVRGEIDTLEASISSMEEEMKRFREGQYIQKEPEREPGEDPVIDGEPTLDDIVRFKDDSGNEVLAKIDSIDVKKEGSQPSDDIYTVQPITSKGVSIGEPLKKSGKDIELLGKVSNALVLDESFDGLSTEEEIVAGTARLHAREMGENTGPLQPLSKLAYTHQDEENPNIIHVRNDALNKAISDPKTSFAKSRAYYRVTPESVKEYGVILKKKITFSQNKLKDLTSKKTEEEGDAVAKKNLKNRIEKFKAQQTLLEKLEEPSELTLGDVANILKTTTGSEYYDLVDNLTISVRVVVDGNSYTKGLTLHDSGYDGIKITRAIKDKGKKAEADHRMAMKSQSRSIRTQILSMILDPNVKEVFTVGLRAGRGAPRTIDKTLTPEERKRNPLKELGYKKGDIVTLGIVKGSPDIKGRYYKGDLYTSERTTKSNTSGFGSPGSTYLITKRTVNGDEYALKLNNSTISSFHSKLLFDALLIKGRADWVFNSKTGKYDKKPKDKELEAKGVVGRYKSKFYKNDNRVWNLSVGEVIDLLVVTGKERTDPDHSRYKTANLTDQHKTVLSHKRLYLEVDKVKGTTYLIFGKEKTRIDLLSIDSIQKYEPIFIEWMMKHKTYVSHLQHKMLNLDLNGDFLEGRKFRIGTKGKGMIERNGTETYAEFILQHGFLTTDAEKGDNGLVFHAPTLDLRLNANRSGKANLSTDKTRKLSTTKEHTVEDETKDIQDKDVRESLQTKTEKEEAKEKPLARPEDELYNIPEDDVKVGEEEEGKPDTVEPTTEKEDDEAEAAPKMKDILDDLESGAPMSRAFDGKPGFEVQNLEKELGWLLERVNIKGDKVELVKELEELVYQGRSNFALYSHSAIRLYQAAEVGTLYHEAFHRVSMGYLTPEERKSLYKKARIMYRMSADKFTDRQVEEKLAEEFREFVLLQKEKKLQSGIKRFFSRILQHIKNWFTGRSRLREGDVNYLFNQINKGRFSVSRVRRENRRNLNGDYLARARIYKGIEFNTIANRKTMLNISKLLTTKLFSLNKIKGNDLDSVKKLDKGLYTKLIAYLEQIIKYTDKVIETSTDDVEVDEAARLGSLFKEVLGEKLENGVWSNFHVFQAFMEDYMSFLGLRTRRDSSQESLDAIDEEEVVGHHDTYDKSSLTLALKDNALASVKFLVSTLHETEFNEKGELVNVRDELTSLRKYVDFNVVWHSLLNDLHYHTNIENMLNELEQLADDYQIGTYKELATILRDSDAITKSQFLTTFRRHKHSYMDFIYKQSGARGVTFFLQDSSYHELSRGNALKWGEMLNLNEDLSTTIAKEGKKGLIVERTINEKAFENLQKRSRALIDTVVTYEEQGTITKEALHQAKLKAIDMLSDINIHVDVVTLNAYLLDKFSNEDEAGRMKDMLLEIEKLYSTKIFDEHLIKNPIAIDLSKAYARAHPEEASDMHLGPGGNKYYGYTTHNLITEESNRIQHDPEWAEDKLGRINNGNSRILKAASERGKDGAFTPESENFRKNFSLVTLSSIKRKRTKKVNDKGTSYTDITRSHDYLMRLGAITSDLNILPMPVMSNRGRYSMMQGAPVINDAITSMDENNNVVFTDEVLDMFYGYYQDEVGRVREAKKLRTLYNDLKKAYDRASEEDMEEAYNTMMGVKADMIKNYHYEDPNFNVNLGNAYKLIHFKGFSLTLNKEQAKLEISKVLNERLQEEVTHASTINVITEDATGLSNNLLPMNLLERKNDEAYAEDMNDFTYAILHALSIYMVNMQMSVFESEKIFFGDPALFKKNKTSTTDVYDDQYKRWFGAGSTGEKFDSTYLNDGDEFSVATFNDPIFESVHIDTMYKYQKELYKEFYLEEKGDTEEDAERKATEMATNAIKNNAFDEVDPTDGTMIISPYMFKSMSNRLGLWGPKQEKAYNLLQSDKRLSPAQEVEASNVVFNPYKTVYIGHHNHNNIDLLIYDKMAMATIFRRQVKGTHMEQVLDRMEAKGKYQHLKPVNAFKFASAVKVGGMLGTDMFVDPQKRDQISDLSKVLVHTQNFDNLRYQPVVSAHNVTHTMFGTQVFKVGGSDIVVDKPYKGFEDGRELLNALTSSREALSDLGKHYIEAKLGIKNGIISDKLLIRMLEIDAETTKKTDDFRQALTKGVDSETGEPYLEIDSFMNKDWVYTRLVTMINKKTIDLNLPGNQLVQVSDYGGTNASTSKELGWNIFDENGTTVKEMEVRVSVKLFKNILPKGLNFTQQQAFLKEELKLLGYRIPTQGQNSVVLLKVVDVLRESSGDVIQLPLEFTKLTGSDFDIDKLYVARYNYKSDKNGYEKIEFSKETDEASAYVRYRDKIEELYLIYKNTPGIFNKRLQAKIRDLTVYSKKSKEVVVRSEENQGEQYSEEDQLVTVVSKLEVLYRKLDEATDPKLMESLNESIDKAEFERSVLEDAVDEINNELAIITEVQKKVILETVKDTLVREGILQDFDTFKKLPISEQNTRKANENRLLDIFFSVLSDRKHYLATSTPLGKSTEVLKLKAEFYNRASKLGIRGEMNSLEMGTPRFQNLMKFLYIGSGKGVPPYALGSAHHPLTQQANIALKTALNLGLKTNKQGLIQFDLIRGQDDMFISTWLSTLIDAHVDAPTDNYIVKLNVNESTHNALSLLIRAGVGETSFDYIAQPILQHYALEFFNNMNQKGFKEKTYNEIWKHWAERGVAAGLAEESLVRNNFKPIPLGTILNENYINRLRSDSTTDIFNEDYYIRQLSILYHFSKIDSDGQSLSNLVRSSQIDTKKFGINPAQQNLFLAKMKEVEESNKWVNLPRLFSSKGESVENGTMLPRLLKNSILYTRKIMSTKSIFATAGFNDIFGTLLYSSASGKRAGKAVVNDIMQETFSYLISGFFSDKVDGLGMTTKAVSNLLNNPRTSIFKQFEDIRQGKHKFSEELLKNPFIKSLMLDFKQDEDNSDEVTLFFKMPFDSLENDFDTDEYIEAVKDLMEHPDQSVKNLFTMIYVYSFFTSGFRSRLYSFHHYFPAAAQREFTIRDLNKKTRVVSFNNYIRRLLRDLNDPTGYQEYALDAVQEVFSNNWENPNIVQQVNQTKVDNEYKDEDGFAYAWSYKISPSDSPNDHFLGKNEDDHIVYSPFILQTNAGGKSILTKYIGINNVDRNPIYVRWTKKGTSFKGTIVKEYGLHFFEEGGEIGTDRSVVLDNASLKYYSEQQMIEMVLRDTADVTLIPTEKQVSVNRNPIKDSHFFFDMILEMTEHTIAEQMLRKERELSKLKQTWHGVTKLITGIQTGVDETLGVDLPMELGLETGGHTTHDYGQEKGANSKKKSEVAGIVPVTIQQMADFKRRNPDVTDAQAYYLVRTELNVKNSDATVYFYNGEKDFSAGLVATRRYAKALEKPFYIYMPMSIRKTRTYTGYGSVFSSPAELRELLIGNGVKVLNVAGSRGSGLTAEQLKQFKELLRLTLAHSTAVTPTKDIKPTLVQSNDAMSTPENPIEVYIDGSVRPVEIEGETSLQDGYGAWITHDGTEHMLSGNQADVQREFFDKFPAVKKQAQRNPSMELLGLLKTLETFKHTNEHIFILQDYDGASRFKGLYGRAVDSEQKRLGMMTPRAPHIVYLVSETVKVIESIEANGGSVRIKWIPESHKETGDYTKKAVANPITFTKVAGEGISNELIDKYNTGNTMADKAANLTDSAKTGLFKATSAKEMRESYNFSTTEQDLDKGTETEEECNK